MSFNEIDLLPCPQCKSENVEWTNSRDLDILSSYIRCDDCGLTTFNVDTMCFIDLPNLDYETTVLKYNAWVMTSPICYHEDNWGSK